MELAVLVRHFAIVVRYVDNFQIEQRLICLQLLAKSLKGEEIAREVVHTLSTEYGVAGNHLLAAARDRVAANSVAMRTIKILFPDVFDIGCYSHTLDHVGEHFDTPFLEEFSLHYFLIALVQEWSGKSLLAELWQLTAIPDGGVVGRYIAS